MLKNKSSSVSISGRSSTSATKSTTNVRQSAGKAKKPTIDRYIAKKLDTLDRQGLKYLKESLKASRMIEHKETNDMEVEEEIYIENDLVENRSPKKFANEIEEEIQELEEYENISAQKVKTVAGGSSRTTIKPRPISALQKENATADKNYSAYLYKDMSSQPVSSPKMSGPFDNFKKAKRQPESELQNLWKRIEKLGSDQRAQLEIVLERMEKGEIDSIEMSNDVVFRNEPKIEYKPPIQSAMQKNRTNIYYEIEEELIEHPEPTQTHQSTMPVVPSAQIFPSKHIHKFSSFKLTNDPTEEVEIKKDKKKAASITIRLMENWGHHSSIGLTQVEIFDNKGRKIIILPDQIVNSNKKLTRLFNGKTFTVDESEMWYCALPKDGKPVEIEVNCKQLIGAVRIWNYNKSLLEIDKGVRKAEIEVKGTKVWEGEISKGNGNEIHDYSSLIVIGLENGVSLQTPVGPVAQKTDRTEKTEKVEKIEKPEKVYKTKPNWLESTLVANKLYDLKREYLKFDNANREIKKNRRGRDSYDRKLYIKDISQDVIRGSETESIGKIEFGQRHRYFYKYAESVYRDVQNSLLNVKKNLNLEGDDIFTYMLANRKSLAGIYKSRQDSLKKKVSEEATTYPVRKSIEVKVMPKEQPKYSKETQRIEHHKSETQKTQITKAEPKLKEPPKQPANNHYLDNLINELNEIIPKNYKVIIPELPSGTILKFNFLLTWGDPYYVGLAGLYIFNEKGEQVQISWNQITSKHELPSSDQTADKLINGIYLTSDSHNQWLSPFKKDSSIKIDLCRPTTISMIRIWNYNESRTHSTRGVRYMSVYLDSKVVFQGEVRKANGEVYRQETLCYYVLFTGNNDLMRKISEGDWLSKVKKQYKIEEQSLRDTMTNFKRPYTSNRRIEGEVKEYEVPVVNYEKRFIQEYETASCPKGYSLRINLRSTWGDRHFIGLNGIEVYSYIGYKLLEKQKFKLKVTPPSVCCLPGYEKDTRTPDKLVNGINQTDNDYNVWLAPFVSDLDRIYKKEANTIVIKFYKSISLGAIDFYNYTKTPYRGVREVEIHLDETLIFMGYLRIGPNRDQKQQIFKTTVGFCKDPDFLKKIKYFNYNEDNLEQAISYVNEQKGTVTQQYQHVPRPSTSVGGKYFS